MFISLSGSLEQKITATCSCVRETVPPTTRTRELRCPRLAGYTWENTSTPSSTAVSSCRTSAIAASPIQAQYSMVIDCRSDRPTDYKSCSGSVGGAIGLVTQLPQDFYEFLQELQTKLSKVIKSIGRIDHANWRSFSSDKKDEACEGFIDGDLIESFLDLNRLVNRK